MKTRNCECCGANYGTGKSYGYEWLEYSRKYNSDGSEVETKGLCEFCNPNSENKWFIKDGMPKCKFKHEIRTRP